jgi:hypothetical protein
MVLICNGMASPGHAGAKTFSPPVHPRPCLNVRLFNYVLIYAGNQVGTGCGL